MSFLVRLWDIVIARPARDIEEECRAFQMSAASRGVDVKTLIILLTTCIVLTLQAYVHSFDVIRWVSEGLEALGFDGDAIFYSDRIQLYELLAWSGLRFVEWLIVPAVIIRLVFRERLTDYGIKLSSFSDGWWLYLLMLSVVLPLVVYVSPGRAFLATYPYYRLGPDEPLWPNLWCWEAAYLAQFFALEFFFRGFMIHGTKHRFGCYSILVMTVPYCMIHFGKPIQETFGSIVAGLVLGFMSLKTRSIWLGTALHITVAVTMDMLALYHMGRFG